MPIKTWTKEEEETLVKLWKEGKTCKEIGIQLKRKRSAIGQYISRHRERLGLDRRPSAMVVRKSKDPFEIQWSGSVPFGHWMITKPWRKQA